MKKGSRRRSWDGMEYQMLMEILKRLSWEDRLMSASKVSKTWMSAVCDLLSPPGVIDITLLDSPELERPPYLAKFFTAFLKRRLDNLPPDSCSSFLQGNTFLLPHKLAYIARRTPSMQELIIPRTLAMTYLGIYDAMVHWKKLKKLQCSSTMMPLCRGSLAELETLHLFGPVNDWVASQIRDKLPRLRQLSLVDCALSANALSIILDGHRDLELLDTRHSYRVPRGRDNLDWSWFHNIILDWNEDEIRVKAAGVKVHLQCARKLCSECDVPYRSLFPQGWCEADAHKPYV